MRVITRGRRWSVDEERRLKELLEAGDSSRQIAVNLGKSFESVRQKMFRLGLSEKNPADVAHLGSSGLPMSRLLPTLEEALVDLYDAIRCLKQPSLSEVDVQRLRSIILGIKVYKDCYAEYRRFREAEEKIMKLTKEFDARAAEDMVQTEEDELGVAAD